MFSDESLLRYSRQIMLPAMDLHGQECLNQSHVLIVGAGGLGWLVSAYLCGAGVGRLTVVDHDQVDLTNIHRQLLYSPADVGRDKVDALAQRLEQMNAEVSVTGIAKRCDEAFLATLSAPDLVIDCTDNDAVRRLLSRWCWRQRVALVSGAAIGMTGQLNVFDYRRVRAGCYDCLYPHVGRDDGACATNGVLGPVVGVVASMQAVEAIKLLANIGDSPQQRMTIYDAAYSEWREIKWQPRTDCSVCAAD